MVLCWYSWFHSSFGYNLDISLCKPRTELAQVWFAGSVELYSWAKPDQLPGEPLSTDSSFTYLLESQKHFQHALSLLWVPFYSFQSGAGSVNVLSVEIEFLTQLRLKAFCDAPSEIVAERGTSVCLPRCFQNLNGGVKHNYWHKMVRFEKFHCMYERRSIVVQGEVRLFACCFIGW